MRSDRNRYDLFDLNTQSVKFKTIWANKEDRLDAKSRTKHTKTLRLKRTLTSPDPMKHPQDSTLIGGEESASCKYSPQIKPSYDLKNRTTKSSTIFVNQTNVVSHYLLLLILAINLPLYTFTLAAHHHNHHHHHHHSDQHHRHPHPQNSDAQSERQTSTIGQEYHSNQHQRAADHHAANLLRVPSSFQMPSSSMSSASSNLRQQPLDTAESRQGHLSSVIPPPVPVDDVDGTPTHSLANPDDTEASPTTDGEDQYNNETPLINDDSRHPSSYQPMASSLSSSSSMGSDVHDDDDESTAENNSQEATPIERNNMLMNHHTSQLKAMHDLFERRHLTHNGQSHQHQTPLQSSQELSPISIGLDPNSPFSLPPFPVGPSDGGPPGPIAKAHLNGPDADTGMGPALPFGLNPLPHLMGFQNGGFQGPQRGDQSAHHGGGGGVPAVAPMGSDSAESGSAGGQKVWPKIFRFTDGRINLSDFEKQKKIRLSNKNQHNGDNYIESAPVMFDGRPLKRKSFLILHGGIFSS